MRKLCMVNWWCWGEYGPGLAICFSVSVCLGTQTADTKKIQYTICDLNLKRAI